MKKLKKLALCAGTGLLCLGYNVAYAQAVPDTVKPPAGGNYGSTSFYDGFGRVTPGWTLLEYGTWAAIDAINNANGDSVSVNTPGGPRRVFNKPSIDAYSLLTQISYTTDWHPFGGDGVGFSAAVPLVDLNSHDGAGSLAHLHANGFGIGDMVWGPIYQSKFYKDGNRPVFAYRFQFIVLSPIGTFSKDKNINQGCGYWAVNPYISMTYVPLPKLEFSTRFNYQYNFATSNIPDNPKYHSGQAGQMIYDNFDASYKITKKFELGFNGFFIDTLTPDKTDGQIVPHSYESEVYIGPGGRYTFTPVDSLNVNIYLPVEAKNESAGPKFNLQYVHRF